MFERAEGLLVGPPAVPPIVLDRIAVPKAGNGEGRGQRDERGGVGGRAARVRGGRGAAGIARERGAAGDHQLHAAVGEEHGDGGDGGAPGVYAAGESDARGRVPSGRQSGEFVLKAEAFVRRLGMRRRGRWGEPDFDGVSERVADCGAAGDGGDGARVFGESDGGGRGGAG